MKEHTSKAARKQSLKKLLQWKERKCQFLKKERLKEFRQSRYNTGQRESLKRESFDAVAEGSRARRCALGDARAPSEALAGVANSRRAKAAEERILWASLGKKDTTCDRDAAASDWQQRLSRDTAFGATHVRFSREEM